jgi:putative transposase
MVARRHPKAVERRYWDGPQCWFERPGAVRKECLGWILVRGRRHLERLLRIYVEHYNPARPHRGLDLATPGVSTPELNQRPSALQLRRRDLLGGLIHEYERAA